jgi:hypothetical protein
MPFCQDAFASNKSYNREESSKKGRVPHGKQLKPGEMVSTVWKKNALLVAQSSLMRQAVFVFAQHQVSLNAPAWQTFI